MPRTRNQLRTAGIICGVVVAVSSADTTRAQDRSPDLGRKEQAEVWSVGLSGSPFSTDARSRGELGVKMSADWTLPRLGLALRPQLTAGAGKARFSTWSADDCDGGPSACDVRSSRQFASFSLLLAKEWGNRSRVSPYAAAGPGVFWERVNPTAMSGVPLSRFSTSSLGAEASVGVSLRLNRFRVFAEQGIQVPGLFGDSYVRSKAPMSFGIRF